MFAEGGDFCPVDRDSWLKASGPAACDGEERRACFAQGKKKRRDCPNWEGEMGTLNRGDLGAWLGGPQSYCLRWPRPSKGVKLKVLPTSCSEEMNWGQTGIWNSVFSTVDRAAHPQQCCLAGRSLAFSLSDFVCFYGERSPIRDIYLWRASPNAWGLRVLVVHGWYICFALIKFPPLRNAE